MLLIEQWNSPGKNVDSNCCNDHIDASTVLFRASQTLSKELVTLVVFPCSPCAKNTSRHNLFKLEIYCNEIKQVSQFQPDPVSYINYFKLRQEYSLRVRVVYNSNNTDEKVVHLICFSSMKHMDFRAYMRYTHVALIHNISERWEEYADYNIGI